MEKSEVGKYKRKVSIKSLQQKKNGVIIKQLYVQNTWKFFLSDRFNCKILVTKPVPIFFLLLLLALS
jgi:hypothetical protein